MKCKNEKRNLKFGVFEDCSVVDESTICVKKLTSDVDIYALRYVAEKLARSNDIEIDDFNSRNAISGNHLYLNDFKGIGINNFIVHNLFMTDDNRVCADCEDLDEDYEPTDNYFVLLVV